MVINDSILSDSLDRQKNVRQSACQDDKYNMKTEKFRSSRQKLINNQQNEFSKIVQQMMKLHTKSEITFNEFMMLLSKFDIKFYSPQEFKKMSKIFNNTFHVLPTNTPFQYLELQAKQASGTHVYYLVRILHKKVDIFLNDAGKQKPTHPAQRCMEDFVILMRKRYGSEINWFKVLGGMTVAVSIDAEIFRGNLAQIMRNTSHHKCIEEIMNLFLEQQSKIVTWHDFMNKIKTHIKRIAEGITLKGKKQFQRKSTQKMETEPCFGYLTVKSKFFTSQKSRIDDRPSSHSLPKQAIFSRSVYGGRRDQGRSKFFGSRCRTQGTQEIELTVSTHQCPIYSKTKASSITFQGRDTEYPMKKNTISLPLNEKRMTRNHFLWRYLKQKLSHH